MNTGEVHKIATYNMSFMSDLSTPAVGKDMPPYISEGAFLAPLMGNPDRRLYWKNALALLRRFMETNPSAVGLQEMNLSEKGSDTGTDAIERMVKSVNPNYELIAGKVVKNNAGVAIIYDTDKLGISKFNHTFDNSIQAGRPIILVVTQKGDKKYLLISMHGAQNAELRLDKPAFNKYMESNNKEFLETEIPKILSENGHDITTMTQIFVMGDFNDRYDAIKNFTFGGKDIKYNGRAPKSCCHNWDSSCPEGEIQAYHLDDYKTCKVPTVVYDKETGKIPLGDRGSIENYRYAGDKVFGGNPISDLMIFESDKRKGVSTESDHELVFATFGDTMAGGRRKNKTRKPKAKKSKKSKKSKKN